MSMVAENGDLLRQTHALVREQLNKTAVLMGEVLAVQFDAKTSEQRQKAAKVGARAAKIYLDKAATGVEVIEEVAELIRERRSYLPQH